MIIVHSVGIGIVLLNCSRLKRETDIRRVLLGYSILITLIIANILHGTATDLGRPPLPVTILYILGALIGVYGIFNIKVE